MGAKDKNFYVELAERYGHGESARAVQDAFLAGDRAGAAAAVTDELIDAGVDRVHARGAARPPGGLRARRGHHACRRPVGRRPRAARPPAGRGGRWPLSPGARPAGIEGSSLPGPWPVGLYAAKLRERLRGFARVQVFGEVWGLAHHPGQGLLRAARRHRRAALLDVARRLGRARRRRLGDGAQVVAGGGADYYVGSRTSSPSFTFLVGELRVAGEGDLLAQVDRLRRLLDAEGLLARQRALPRPLLPRTIGVVTGEGGKARDDVLAGLRRRGWAGRLVWGFAPVQDRHAAPRIAQALRDLVADAEPDVIVVARGGGSLADLFAFCDESLCRTVAHLPVPVIASVGHHTDRTLIDDVAAVSCSTPTHAAETAVGLDVGAARAELRRGAERLRGHGRRAVLDRARVLVRLSRAPEEHVARHRRRLHQQLRELRASARRRGGGERQVTARRALVIDRKATLAAGADAARRRRELDRLALALAAHDPGAHAGPRLRAGRGPRRGAALLGRGRPRRPRRPAALPRWRGGGRGRVSAQPHSYEAASARLEEIIRRLDSGEAGLRETLELVREGRVLVEYCAGELDAVSRGLEELRLDELVARLEASAAPPPDPA